jgi:hypothetical protein
MRWCVSIGAVLVAGAIAGGDVPGLAAPAAPSSPAAAEAKVDVELILAVDVSYSMDMDELALQREGYALAVTSKEFLQALKTGPTGKVAVTYFEWAASTDQKIVVPWRVIDGPESLRLALMHIEVEIENPAGRGAQQGIADVRNEDVR